MGIAPHLAMNEGPTAWGGKTLLRYAQPYGGHDGDTYHVQRTKALPSAFAAFRTLCRQSDLPTARWTTSQRSLNLAVEWGCRTSVGARVAGSTIRGFQGRRAVLSAGSGCQRHRRGGDQLGMRQGAAAVYFRRMAPDLPEFLQLRTNNGDDRMKAHDVFPPCYPDSLLTGGGEL